jgi:uncharacterized protein
MSEFDQDRALETQSADPVAIPHAELAPATLRKVIEAFVLREGTEYGQHDFSLEQKVTQVMTQLDRGDARVVFHPDSQSVEIVATRG